MVHSTHFGKTPFLLIVVVAVVLQNIIHTTNAFALQYSSPRIRIVSPSITITSVSAMNKRTKFSKQKDLAQKMAEAKRQREIEEGGESSSQQVIHEEPELLTAEEIKLRNDRQRFADLLDNSSMNSSGDFDKGFYLTVEQENENADAVCEYINLYTNKFIYVANFLLLDGTSLIYLLQSILCIIFLTSILETFIPRIHLYFYCIMLCKYIPCT